LNRFRLIFEKQWLHGMALAVLLLAFGWFSRANRFPVGDLWGIGTEAWAWIAVLLAVAHQGLVWFCWRTQLHFSLLSRLFGRGGFPVYAVLFSVLGIARVVAVFLVAFANRGTVAVAPVRLKIIALVLTVPTVYLFYSVQRYFGFRRAFGIDHFDVSYRSRPLVQGGIFRFTRNGMYVHGFLLLWIPGLWWASVAGLAVALFNHLYIWVHYHATELPDMKRIYGEPSPVPSGPVFLGSHRVDEPTDGRGRPGPEN